LGIFSPWKLENHVLTDELETTSIRRTVRLLAYSDHHHIGRTGARFVTIRNAAGAGYVRFVVSPPGGKQFLLADAAFQHGGFLLCGISAIDPAR
jgi:hypothetical protein